MSTGAHDPDAEYPVHTMPAKTPITRATNGTMIARLAPGRCTGRLSVSCPGITSPSAYGRPSTRARRSSRRIAPKSARKAMTSHTSRAAAIA